MEIETSRKRNKRFREMHEQICKGSESNGVDMDQM